MVMAGTGRMLGPGAWALTLCLASPAPRAGAADPPRLFETADRCQACHNGLTTPSGRDVSIGLDWRASMMAHSARDPYWQAAVRREVLDHPRARAAIEHECSRCHMPMAHWSQVAAGGRGSVFANLPVRAAGPATAFAADGVSCTVCHQVRPEGLGTRASFTGHLVVDTKAPLGERPVFGPFAIEKGLRRLMHSASAFRPEEGAHVRSSELCATCHTLYTHALHEDGQSEGELPEQVPYLEWRHSAYRETRSCQSCHMPVVEEPVRVSSTLGEPRTEVSRHTFRGANFSMLRVLNRYRDELGVETLPSELELGARDAIDQLQRDTASLAIERLERRDGLLVVEVAIANRAGHKLPTAYPSRRAWLHLAVRDEARRLVFESGAFTPEGRVAGNDNDEDPAAYEPHYPEITSAGQVQIYESIMADGRGAVTTGLLSGVRYLKDNRLLPDGFDKATAQPDISVQGEASADPDFRAGGDRVRYRLAVEGDRPLTVEAELLYQSIGYRWAQNLRLRAAPETDRFVRYYESMSGIMTERLAQARAETR
jgi:hypothetical protein